LGGLPPIVPAGIGNVFIAGIRPARVLPWKGPIERFGILVAKYVVLLDVAATFSGVETVDIPVPADIAERIDAIAGARHVSRDRAMADLLREAITAYEQRRESFLELAGRFQNSTDPAESEQLRGELARMTFGD
jgi:hypothetical protein